MQLNNSFLLLFPHPGAISPMGAISRMTTVCILVALLYMCILFTRANSSKSEFLTIRMFLHDSSVVSAHRIIIENRPVDPGTITQGSHRPTGSI